MKSTHPEPALIELSAALPLGKDGDGISVTVYWTDLDRGWCRIEAKGFATWPGTKARAKCPEWFATELERARAKFAERQGARS